MTFIVILISLLIERFFDWSHIRNWNWFYALQRQLMTGFQRYTSPLTLIISIVFPVIIVSLVDYILHPILYPFLALVFNLLLLLYCFGPQNLWADTFSTTNGLQAKDVDLTINRIKTTFGVIETSDLHSLHKQLLKNIFISANRRIFTAIFWFALLGIPGALFYRLVSLSANNMSLPPESIQQMKIAEAALEWVPTRLFILFFALGGHFVYVMQCWHKHLRLGLFGNEVLISDCGIAALGFDIDTFPDDCSIEKSAINLLDRAFVIFLVLIALMVLVT